MPSCERLRLPIWQERCNTVCRRTLSSTPPEYYVVPPIRAESQIGHAITKWTSMLDRLISRNSQKSDTTSNTLIVTCAIPIVIAILVFPELHIRRSLLHSQSVVSNWRPALDPSRLRASIVVTPCSGFVPARLATENGRSSANQSSN